VYTTDFLICEPSKPLRSPKWFSHKFKKAGLRYEIAVSLKGGHIVWINGPYECGTWPDIEIFRNSLKSFLEPGERVEADDGYIGEEPEFCKTPSGFSSRSECQDKFRSRLRSRHETVNARIKNFGILQNRYRHELTKHSLVFRACAVLSQLAIENGEPLFEL
jgi:hypothetical protein